VKDGKLFNFIVDQLEKAGDYRSAWQYAAEIAQSSPPDHPIHKRLLSLEALIQERQDSPPQRKPLSLKP